MRVEDKRNFTRYIRKSECEIRVDSEIYKGMVVDYSDGVGVITKNVPQLVKGTQADIKILDYEIEFRAEIVWTTELGYHLRAGFRRIDNLKGNLRYYRLADVFIGISRSRKTGILEITSGSISKKIYIKNGDKIFATSSSEDDRLGEYLLKQGEITLEEFNQASYLVSKTGRRLGKVLIDLGYLKSNDLVRVVRYQVENIIMSLFNVEEGRFEFKEGTLPTDEVITLQVSSANLIYKGIKQINNFVLVKKMCPSEDTIFNLSQNPMHMFKSLTLEDSDKKILSYVNGNNPLKAILSLSPSTNFETLKTIITLHSIGLIHIKGEDEAPATLPLELIFGEPDEEATEEFIEKIHEDETVMEEVRDVEETLRNPEPIESHEDIVSAAKEEKSIIAESDKAENENKDLDLTSSPEDETVMEEVRDVEETLRNPEPIASPEDIVSAAEEEESIIAESDEAEEEEYIQVHDKTAEEITEEVKLDTIRATDVNIVASEKIKFKRNWIYVTVLVLSIAVLSAIVPLVYDNIKTFFSPPLVPTVKKTVSLPSFRDKASAKVPLEILERTTQFPTFREEALRKLLSE